MKYSNDLFLRALRKQDVERTPVWVMRQAGRYMPEYRALRAKSGDFLTLCKNPELACQTTMLPLNKFALDAAIIFSDILLIPDAMGLGLTFVADEGPKFAKVINNLQDVAQLPEIDPEQDLGYLSAAIKMTVAEINGAVPLIGFAGSPWTLATYMIEGQTSKQFNKVRGMLYQSPQVMHKLLAHLSAQIAKVLIAQINAGVAAVMIFDSWAAILSDPLFKEFSLHYMREIVNIVKSSHPAVPIILFVKNGGRCIVDIANTGCNAIGLDWTADLTVSRKLVGDKVALQGNLDPCVLYAAPEIIVAKVQEVLKNYGPGNGHIFNLGHGIPPDVKPDHLQVMIEAIQSYSPAYHTKNTVLT